MPRKKAKTIITIVKMSPELRILWEQCAEHESRSLTNLFEVLLRDYAKRLGVTPDPQRVAAAAEAGASVYSVDATADPRGPQRALPPCVVGAGRQDVGPADLSAVSAS